MSVRLPPLELDSAVLLAPADPKGVDPAYPDPQRFLTGAIATRSGSRLEPHSLQLTQISCFLVHSGLFTRQHKWRSLSCVYVCLLLSFELIPALPLFPPQAPRGCRGLSPARGFPNLPVRVNEAEGGARVPTDVQSISRKSRPLQLPTKFPLRVKHVQQEPRGGFGGNRHPF